ncbi:hypothetical protein N007_21075 [Alicyclobacillus acidoterrestris ATCC 49025]|nr:hypothetical protein N007_21075 [Alicyclobacillus acidoterrestris ATCC 49025]
MHKNLSSSLEQQLQTVLGITENSWDKAELNVTAINGTYTPVLQIGGQSIPINLTDQTIQTFDSPNGTIYKLAGQTTILGSTATLVLDFIPNTDYHQGTITIMDPNGPVVEFFGTAFLTQQDENTITSNSPKTASNATIAPAATSSPEWHFQGNNDTQTIMGKSIGKNTCVIGGSDYFNGPSSGSERVEVWGTTEAENYLNNYYKNYYAGSPGADTADTSSYVDLAVLAVQDPSQYGLTFPTDTISPAAETGNNMISEWSWLLDYVPYVGSALDALAQDIHIDIIKIASSNEYYEQVNQSFNLGDGQHILPSGTAFNEAEGHKSYAEQFAFNGGKGNTIKLIGYVRYDTFIPSSTTDSTNYYETDTPTPDVSMTPTVQYQANYSG